MREKPKETIVQPQQVPKEPLIHLRGRAKAAIHGARIESGTILVEDDAELILSGPDIRRAS